MKSYQTQFGVFTGVVNDLPVIPYEAVAVPIPAELPAGRAWLWKSSYTDGHRKWGQEGSWQGVADNTGKVLYQADGSQYMWGPNYRGYGDVPSWLTEDVRPTANHKLVDSKWVLDDAGATAYRAQLVGEGVVRIDSAYFNALYMHSIKQVERQMKVEEASNLDGPTPLLDSYATTKGITREAAAAEVMARAEDAANHIKELSVLRNLKYGYQSLATWQEVKAYTESAVSRIEALGQKLA